MTKPIPKIDELLDGINDTDDIPEPGSTEKAAQSAVEVTQPPDIPVDEENTERDRCWDSFMSHLDDSVEIGDRDERLVCKIDRDLADSLDDCDIGNRCRSDLVNAIVRAFFETHITRLLKFRREKKSLFLKLKEN